MIMGIEKQTREKRSLIDIAKQVMIEKKQAMSFSQLYSEVTQIKGLNEMEKRSRMSQFYTDLNADGVFVFNDNNQWILKRWGKNV